MKVSYEGHFLQGWLGSVKFIYNLILIQGLFLLRIHASYGPQTDFYIRIEMFPLLLGS